ncbi:acyl-coenzyme A diphosphatase NUDT19 [Peromyscus maniculatus bairdii]|uniref:acyl-coenzyme A diphosphatase NUDT19 n=1 Tax=Peromyscus maniculatus bairdii TaxID=230844 RepID=UPI00042AD080|nr:nucleoside diphosphate-linked moiety X motif 19 [Peromyscus maniculatus bairdii]
MSVPLRSGRSTWRRAATVVLAAGWNRPSPGAPQSADDFRLLLLERAPNQRFMPGAHVFPGGVLDAADSSADWLRLFAPRHTPSRFGLGPAPPQHPSFPGLVHDNAHAGALPDDVALRICAVREAFEEAGVLLLRPRDSAPASPGPGLALSPPPGLADWRSRVRSDPRCFLQLCEHLDCTPDIWALSNWGGWLTPYGRGTRRFDTTFLLCCLRETPPVDPDLTEVVGYKWLSPSEATERFLSKEIWLAPPQFYEMRRLETFDSLSALYRFSSDHPLEITEKWLPIVLLTADGSINLLPGDELYVKDSDFLEKPMSTDKKTEELVKEGKVVNRMVIHSLYHYELYVSLLSKDKLVYPKNYVVNKSLPAHL